MNNPGLVATTLQGNGIGFASTVVETCLRYNVPVEYACVLLMKETSGGKNIYGHDAGAYPYVPRDVTVEVTKENYLEYLASIFEGGKRNGVGPLQITHYTLQDLADARGGAWRPEVSIDVGIEHFGKLLTRYGERGAFERWRGLGPGAAYADHAVTLLPYWKQLIEDANKGDSMGYALLEKPNPHGNHFYTTRVNPLLAYVVHVTAGLEDLDATDDQSAERVVAYCQSVNRDVSWHVSTDTDSTIELLPPSYTAWHASSYNSTTYGHEISKLNTDWRPGIKVSVNWISKSLAQAAKHASKIAKQYNIPVRKATRAELDREKAKGKDGKPVGFLGHWEVDPSRRDDPGRLVGTSVDTFPWASFLGLVKDYMNGEEDLNEWQNNMLESIHQAIFGPEEDWERTGALTSDRGLLERVAELENPVKSTYTQVFYPTPAEYPPTSEATYGPAVNTQLKEILSAVKNFTPGEGGAIDLKALAELLAPALVGPLADELDRRNRDSDPKTGTPS